MRLVNDFGDIVRMSESAYRRYLRHGAMGMPKSASDYGKVIADLSFTATDAEPEDFQNALDAAGLGARANKCAKCGAAPSEMCRGKRNRWSGEFKYMKTVHRARRERGEG